MNILLALFVLFSSSDVLPRRAIFGAQILPASSGVAVGAVNAQGAAAAAGVVTGDTILSIGGTKVSDPGQFVNALKSAGSGAVDLEIVHDGNRVVKKLQLVEAPRESSPDFDVIYDSVRANGALRRTIITKPHGDGSHPAVIFAGGIGCYSLDGAPPAVNGYIALIQELTRRGFVVMRVEKSSMGDSRGVPCAEQDFENELSGYRAGLQKLKTYPYVDPKRVFLIGHSIGGLVAPVIASETPLRGVVAMSLAGHKWVDYEDINAKRQLTMEGRTGEDLDAALKIRASCARKLLLTNATPEAIVNAEPRCGEYLHYPAHYTYMKQVAAIDPVALWKKVSAPVLLIHGQSDFVTDADEHRLIVDAINSVHPGGATLLLEENMDHFMRQVGSQAESLKALKSNALDANPLNAKVRDDIAKWLLAHAT